jgi:hypothetical protein
MFSSMWKRPHVKYLLFLLDFNETWIFSQIFKNVSSMKFHKNSPVGAELFHADGQKDMTKLIVAFRNFANATKKVCDERQYVFIEGRNRKFTALTIPALYPILLSVQKGWGMVEFWKAKAAENWLFEYAAK